LLASPPVRSLDVPSDRVFLLQQVDQIAQLILVEVPRGWEIVGSPAWLTSNRRPGTEAAHEDKEPGMFRRFRVLLAISCHGGIGRLLGIVGYDDAGRRVMDAGRPFKLLDALCKARHGL